MSSNVPAYTPRNRRFQVSDAAKNRHSSYNPPTESLDVLSLLTPSAQSRFRSTGAKLPASRPPQSKLVYSINTGSQEKVSSNDANKRKVFGKSSIYSALEAALDLEDEVSNKDASDVPMRRTNSESIPGKSEDVDSFPTVRSRIQSLYCEKNFAEKRHIPPVSPRSSHDSEKRGRYNSSVRRVSYGNMERPQSVCVTSPRSESDDSGCEANFEGSPTPSRGSKHRMPSIASIDSALGATSPRYSVTSPEPLLSPPDFTEKPIFRNDVDERKPPVDTTGEKKKPKVAVTVEITPTVTKDMVSKVKVAKSNNVKDVKDKKKHVKPITISTDVQIGVSESPNKNSKLDDVSGSDSKKSDPKDAKPLMKTRSSKFALFNQDEAEKDDEIAVIVKNEIENKKTEDEVENLNKDDNTLPVIKNEDKRKSSEDKLRKEKRAHKKKSKDTDTSSNETKRKEKSDEKGRSRRKEKEKDKSEGSSSSRRKREGEKESSGIKKREKDSQAQTIKENITDAEGIEKEVKTHKRHSKDRKKDESQMNEVPKAHGKAERADVCDNDIKVLKIKETGNGNMVDDKANEVNIKERSHKKENERGKSKEKKKKSKEFNDVDKENEKTTKPLLKTKSSKYLLFNTAEDGADDNELKDVNDSTVCKVDITTEQQSAGKLNEFPEPDKEKSEAYEPSLHTCEAEAPLVIPAEMTLEPSKTADTVQVADVSTSVEGASAIEGLKAGETGDLVEPAASVEPAAEAAVPITHRVEKIATSPVTSSDESDKEWRKKIISTRNYIRPSSGNAGSGLQSSKTLLKPTFSAILEGQSDASENEKSDNDVLSELPILKKSTTFRRQYSTPLAVTEKQTSAPLQPGKRRKTQKKKDVRESEQQTAAPNINLKLPSVHPPGTETDFSGLDDLVTPSFKNERANLRPRRRTTTTQNPMKLMQEREKKQEEEKAEEEKKKNKEANDKPALGKSTPAAHWRKARLAASAINGLQMTIDFAKAAKGLRKTEKRADGTALASKAAGEESTIVSSFPPKILLLLKGRKNVQCMHVECKVSSLNSGDVFILVTPTELFQFIGIEANVHEKAKGNDLIERIVRNKELGCTAGKSVTLLERDMDMCKKDFKRFFELLMGRPPISEKEAGLDDREFERRYQMEARVKVFSESTKSEDKENSVDDTEDKFVGVNVGKRLKYEMLDEKKVFLIDFVTEHYIWCGKGVALSVRKKAIQLAQDLYKESLNTAAMPPPSSTLQGGKGSSRRVSCTSRSSVTSRGSIDSTGFGRRMSTTSNSSRRSSLAVAHSVSMSPSPTPPGGGRRVSLSINSGISRSRISVDSITSRSSLDKSSSRRQSTSSNQSKRISVTSCRNSITSGGRSSRRSSAMSTTSVHSNHGDESPKPSPGNRRISVSTKVVKALIHGASSAKKAEVTPILPTFRPQWAMNITTIQGKEPICLREKFADWPEPGRIIKMKGHATDDKDGSSLVAQSQPLTPYDANLMHVSQSPEEVLKLEYTHLGRGRGTFKRYNDEVTIITDKVTAWLVHEYKNFLLPESYYHILYANEGYVVRWEYRLEEYDGFVRKTTAKRCAYYFWQGSECEINMKGATALMTVELDKEKGPQVRVVQNREPPSFLNLFKGKLLVRTDTRPQLDKEPNLGRRRYPTEVEMFIVRGDCEEEIHLHQVEPKTSSLRSRGCFVIVSPDCEIFVWIGSKCMPHTREFVIKAGHDVKNNYSGDEASVVQVEENSEPTRLITLLGGNQEYGKLVSSIESHHYTPRMFIFSSTSGTFKADEILCRHRVPNIDTQFPFIQDDLYGASQPALILVDAKYQLWLWQGWFETSGDGEKTTGSSRQHFAANKKVAMETINEYVELMMLADNPKVYPIEAGDEPLEFTTLFPFWAEREDVKRHHIQNQLQYGGHKTESGRRTSINTAYRMLTRTEYTFEELKQKPEGVDPAKLEEYLSEEEFKKILGITREEFKKMKKWKQVTLKQQKGLY